MSPSRKTTIQLAALILLTAGAQLAYGAAASTAPVAIPSNTAPATVTPMVAATPPADARLHALLGQMSYPNARTAVPVLVIPAKEMDAQVFTRIVEDLSIMSRIIEKNLQGEVMERFGFTMITREPILLPSDPTGPRILRSSSGGPKAMYVGGYGAVFSLSVGFPLVPPPQVPEPNNAAEPTDRVWAQAQRELLDPRAASHPAQGVPQESLYNAQAVADLRATLIALLKHATNIRDLEPEAWLTILVQGPAPTAPGRLPGSPYDETNLAGLYQNLLSDAPDMGRTLMTLRARKADIDQYAKGQLDEAQFQQRVQVVTH